jgi:hypothetical protein
MMSILLFPGMKSPLSAQCQARRAALGREAPGCARSRAIRKPQHALIAIGPYLRHPTKCRPSVELTRVRLRPASGQNRRSLSLYENLLR